MRSSECSKAASLNAGVRQNKMNAVFGEKIAHMEYTLRKGAYAVIIDDQDVAAIKGTSSYFLPGGGREGTETDEETLARELHEECEASVEILSTIGQATDFLFSAAEDHHFEKHGTFCLARLLTPPNENLIWIPISDASRFFRQEGHVWAITRALAM